jgi:oxygen-independent coproporphyrinogen-3 oxidase
MSTQAELLAARVPRYTSYPTAPHFHGGVDRRVFERWLRELPSEMPLSLYFHIPFCDSLCWFCACHTRVMNNYGPVKSYLAVLRKEVAAVAKIVGGSHSVSHIHFGGGSPTMLAPADFRAFIDDIRHCFAVAGNAEFAIEIDPRGLSDEMVHALGESGVNRASIGVQDSDPRVQRAINRIQPFSVTRSAVERLRAVGVSNLNIDLVYGLPYQTTNLLRNTIEQAVTLDRDRLAIFGYAHVPHFKKHQALIDADALPGLEARREAFDVAHAMLTNLGYISVGLDHFAKPGDSLARASAMGRLSRNFQGYTTDSAPALIGMGASAISALPQGYAQNAVDVPQYRASVLGEGLGTAKGISLTNDDRMRAAVIERLMCDLVVDLEKIALQFGQPPTVFASDMRSLSTLIAEGFVTIDGWKITVPSEVRIAVRCVCAAFDKYLQQSEGRHAIAV